MKTLLSLTTTASLALSGVSFASAQHYTQINLVANTSGIAPVTDPHFVNPWGLSPTSGSPNAPRCAEIDVRSVGIAMLEQRRPAEDREVHASGRDRIKKRSGGQVSDLA